MPLVVVVAVATDDSTHSNKAFCIITHSALENAKKAPRTRAQGWFHPASRA